MFYLIRFYLILVICFIEWFYLTFVTFKISDFTFALWYLYFWGLVISTWYFELFNFYFSHYDIMIFLYFRFYFPVMIFKSKWFLFITDDISIFVNYFNSLMSYQFWITRMIWYLRFHGLLLGSDVYLLRFYFDNMIFNLSRFIFSIWYFRLLWFYLNFMIYSAISILFSFNDIFYISDFI